LCTLTALACAVVMLRSYRRTGHRLLMWSGWCFVGLSVNNLLLVFDKVVFPQTDLTAARLLSGLISLLLLLFGLIYEKE
jgi:hypothetical protein